MNPEIKFHKLVWDENKPGKDVIIRSTIITKQQYRVQQTQHWTRVYWAGAPLP